MDAGSTQLGVNVPGAIFHAALHGARRDIKCAIHVQTSAAVAVSVYYRPCYCDCLILQVSVVNCGMLPISSEADAVSKQCTSDLTTT